MAALPVRRLGRVGITVSTTGLGGAPLGNLLGKVDDAEAVATVKGAYELGVRYFDVAPQYGHGLAEHRFGRFLRTVPRDTFVLSSKVGRLLKPNPSGMAKSPLFVEPLPFDLVNDYGYDATIRSIEDSLQRLGLPRIDIAFIHNIDPDNHPPAVVDELFAKAMSGAHKALIRLREEGTISAFGVGNNVTTMCERFARAGDFDCFLLAGRYTLLEQGALDTFLPYCESRNIAIVMGGPFNSGILATGAVSGAHYNYAPAPAPILDKVRRIEVVCRRHGVDLAAAALQFPLAHPCVVSVIPGARSPAEIRQNTALAQKVIPADFWVELKSAGLIAGHVPVPAA
jgi:D-threo-aldose 1-dehydrogenase